MFYFRINRLKIFNNFEHRKFLGVLGKDLAQIKLISFVSTTNNQFPVLDDYINTMDAAEQNDLLKTAIEQIVGSRILTEIQNVKDGHEMTFGDTGYVLYSSEKIPENFDWMFVAYESDRNVRTTAQIIEDIVGSKDFDNFSQALPKIAKGLSNPAYAIYVEIAKYATRVISDVAKKNKDDMIGILYTSLNRREHYPHGERKKDDIADLTNNMRIDYSIFGFDN